MPNEIEQIQPLPPKEAKSESASPLTPAADVIAVHAPLPPAEAAPNAGLKGDLVVLYRYLVQSEVHTYAFSVAANSILAFYPLVLMLYAAARHLSHSRTISESLISAIIGIVQFFLPLLPEGMNMVTRNLGGDASRQTLNLISLFSLLIGLAGIFLPLEVALNRVWGVTKHRNFLMNQVVSFGLSFALLLVAMGSVVVNALQRAGLTMMLYGRVLQPVDCAIKATHGSVRGSMFCEGTQAATAISGTVAGILFFFLVYWLLPNRKIPARAVLPTAIVTGLLWEFSRLVYIWLLPKFDLDAAYGIFKISASVILWSYVSGLIMLAGAQFSANRHALKLAHEADVEQEREHPVGH